MASVTVIRVAAGALGIITMGCSAHRSQIAAEDAAFSRPSPTVLKFHYGGEPAFVLRDEVTGAFFDGSGGLYLRLRGHEAAQSVDGCCAARVRQEVAR